ncbi:ferritin-like domain-containing protein [Mesonia aestuariivivens]|uniref:Ferritin-like domain-containing protein n=1 Tax=Mesonia aestuariivivens TaxID=2796128 RepID=A0ABS6W262_9FLAO|nr:ferritin-like domain-containing protein [Mesonia aestuariivivens]MBW2961928.1 ferritin-like domain-containing protein [Mesonia aestuariivivens]
MKNKNVKVERLVTQKGNKRRQFLKMSGLAIAGSGLILSCSDDDDFTENVPDLFDLGSGDLGVLNYAYALEQLEADFYTKVVNGSYWSGAAAEEKQILEDLYNHEVNHREFFKAALNANFDAELVLPESLEFDFSTVNFSNRDSVLETAQLLEDTGVKAYNGAGKLIETAAYLVIAGKIVSVEARHAAAIRSIRGNDMDDFKLFAGDDIVDSQSGLDGAENPSVIINAAKDFFVTPFTANQLP